MPETCQREKPGGGWGRRVRCDRKLTTDDQRAAGLCGPCLAGKIRSDKADAEKRRRAADSEAARRSAVALVDRLAAIGVGASPRYVQGYGSALGVHDGGVVLDAEAAAYVVRRLEGVR